jgi:inosine-uridine nucleoside N-ribohydrolase
MSVYRALCGFAIVALALGMVTMRTISAEEGEAVRLIFDTDLESDVDDAGTVALLHALADRGEVKLLAMGISSRHPSSAPCLDALNTYYGRGDIPIGILKGEGGDNGSKYAQTIAKEFPHDLASVEEAPSATSLYRRVLASQPDRSVVIVTVGFLTNVRNLLASGPDDASKLSGEQLVQRKVKAWVCMGGAGTRRRRCTPCGDSAAVWTSSGTYTVAARCT